MKIGYCGKDTKAGTVRKAYVGVNGVARRCTKAYVGVNGVARLLYPTENIDIPSVSGTYTFDNQPHSAVITDLDPDAVNITGQTTATDGGVYPIVFSLASQYFTWSDGTKTDKTGSWEIETVTVDIPSVSGSYNYDGTVKEAVITDLDPTYVRVTGVTSTKNAGNYTIYFDLVSPNGCVWSDGTTERKTGTWSIAAGILAVPTLQGTYTYSGSAQTVFITEYDTSKIAQSGIKTAVDAGTYTVYFDIIDPNYEWSDHTTERKSANWTINKMQLHIDISNAGESTSSNYINYHATFTVKDINNRTVTTANMQYSDRTETHDAWYTIDGTDSKSFDQAAGVATYKWEIFGSIEWGVETETDAYINLIVTASVAETANYTSASRTWTYTML